MLVVLARLWGLDAQEYLELRAFDALIRYRPQPSARTDLVHVDIDDQSIEQVGRWAWPRTQHAHLVETLRELGARAVVFDLEFSEPTRPQLEEETLAQTVTSPLQQQAQALETAVGELTRQVRQSKEASVSADDFEAVLGQLSQLFRSTAALVQSNLSQAVERPDDRFARAMGEAGTVYLALSVAPPDPDPLESSLVGRALVLLREDLWVSPSELAQALDLPESRLLEYDTALREQVALTEAELLLIDDPQTPVEQVLEELLGDPSSRSLAQERLVRRAYDRARALRVLLAQSRTRPPEHGADALPRSARVATPVSILAEGAAGLGTVNAVPDLDGKHRRAHLFWRFRDHLLPHLSVVVLSHLLDVGLESVQVEPGVSVTFPAASFPGEERRREVVIPVDGEGATLINWALAPVRDRDRSPYGDSFPRVSAATVLELWDIERVLERTYLALDDYAGGRQAGLLDALDALDPSAGDGEEARRLRQELAQVRLDVRQFLARQVSRTRARIDASTDGAERAELAEALKPLGEQLQLLERREARRRQLLEHLKPIVAQAVCFVGATFTAGTDFHPVPFHTHLPGVCNYSHLINMVLEGSFLRRAGVSAGVAAVLLCGLLAGFFSATMRATRSGLWALLVVILYVVFSYWCFTRWGLWLDTVGPAAAALASFTLVTAYRQLTEERQKRWIRNVFQHYLSPEVVSEVLEQPDLLGLRGSIQEVTVFFSDLANFTSIAEGLPPEELTQLLNDYLTPMSNIIQEHGGCLDKYEGDLIMSFFGAPVQYPDHARRACLAALENQARLAQLRQGFRRDGRPLLYCRIGLASGLVRVGNMGSEMRFDYTVMGDTANLASRLEGANKLYATSILISESTRTAVGDAIRARELDLIRVKGRAEPVRVYELLAKAGELEESWEEALKLFAEGLRLYRERRWQPAADQFRQVLAARSGDGPAAAFLRRCREYQENPPPGDWDGVFVATEK